MNYQLRAGTISVLLWTLELEPWNPIVYIEKQRKAGALVQKIFLSTSRIATGSVTTIDRLLDPLVVWLTEKSHNTERYHIDPYGRFEEIVKGVHSGLPKEARYLGILRKQASQFAWDRGPHSGSIDPHEYFAGAEPFQGALASGRAQR